MGATQFLATDVELANLHQQAKVWVNSPGERGEQDQITPTLFVSVWQHGEAPTARVLRVYSFHVPFSSHEEKTATLQQAGANVYRDRCLPIAASLASEAWVSQEILSPSGERRYAEPKDDPNRREVALVATMSFGRKRTLMADRLYKRRRAGGPLQFAGDWNERTGAQFPLLQHFFLGFAVASGFLVRTPGGEYVRS